MKNGTYEYCRLFFHSCNKLHSRFFFEVGGGGKSGLGLIDSTINLEFSSLDQVEESKI